MDPVLERRRLGNSVRENPQHSSQRAPFRDQVSDVSSHALDDQISSPQRRADSKTREFASGETVSIPVRATMFS
jgi:hypothetical protein